MYRLVPKKIGLFAVSTLCFLLWIVSFIYNPLGSCWYVRINRGSKYCFLVRTIIQYIFSYVYDNSKCRSNVHPLHILYNVVHIHMCHHRLNFIATTIIIFIIIPLRKTVFDTFIAHVPFSIDQNCYTHISTLYMTLVSCRFLRDLLDYSAQANRVIFSCYFSFWTYIKSYTLHAYVAIYINVYDTPGKVTPSIHRFLTVSTQLN